MSAFYFINSSLVYLFLAFSLIILATQAIYVSLIVFRYIKSNMLHTATEFLLLLYAATLAIVPAFTEVNRRYGVVEEISYMYILAIPIILASLLLVIKKDRFYIVAIVSILLTLPVIACAGYHIYIIAYICALGLFFWRTITVIVQGLQISRNSITSLSIKEGLDNLDSAIMFYDKDGYIYLMNNAMQKNMFRFFNRVFQNGNIFWEAICSYSIVDIECYTIEQDVVFRTDTDTWRFSKREFQIEGKDYIELIATDVSEIDKTFLALEKKEEVLLQQQLDLQKLSKNMIKIRQEQEYALLRSQVHDIMGQRLSALQRILQTKDKDSNNAIIPLLQDLVDNIQDEYKPSFQQSFFELKKYYEKIGVSMIERGEFPKKEEIAFVFLAIIREATTNAIRHAQSTEIVIEITNQNNCYQMKITNNGISPTEQITEGSGIVGNRDRVKIIGGEVHICSTPIFSITITASSNK